MGENETPLLSFAVIVATEGGGDDRMPSPHDFLVSCFSVTQLPHGTDDLIHPFSQKESGDMFLKPYRNRLLTSSELVLKFL